jgi:excisionase family DNA binding protein
MYFALGEHHCWTCEDPGDSEAVSGRDQTTGEEGEGVSDVTGYAPASVVEMLEAVTAGPHRPPDRVDELLSVKEAAAALGISQSAVHWHLSKGRMSKVVRGHTYYLPRAAVEAFRLELPTLRQGESSAAKGHKPAPDHPWKGLPRLETKAAPAPTLAQLLEAHTAATSRYLKLHAQWQLAIAAERNLCIQVTEAEAAQQEASKRLGAGLAALRAGTANGKEVKA